MKNIFKFNSKIEAKPNHVKPYIRYNCVKRELPASIMKYGINKNVAMFFNNLVVNILNILFKKFIKLTRILNY